MLIQLTLLLFIPELCSEFIKYSYQVACVCLLYQQEFLSLRQNRRAYMLTTQRYLRKGLRATAPFSVLPILKSVQSFPGIGIFRKCPVLPIVARFTEQSGTFFGLARRVRLGCW